MIIIEVIAVLYYLAIDIGASSGRHIIGIQSETCDMKYEEVYRFENQIKKEDEHLIWDIEYIFSKIKEGILIALNKYRKIESVSIDTWGVDYIILNNDKEVYPCYAYRDNRTLPFIKEVHKRISFECLYDKTGIQFQPFNTIYQLYCDLKINRLKNGCEVLLLAEYFIYRLTGVKCHEITNWSTTGLLDFETRGFALEIIDKLGFPKTIVSKLVQPGYVVGDFTKEVQAEVGGNIRTILCATHDTASAVEGLPIGLNEPYISSGTWSLLGVKQNKAIYSKQARDENYSNEYGPNYFRFQKNIMGLWIIQELSKETSLSFSDIVEKSKTSTFGEIYDVNDSCFLSTSGMKKEIVKWFQRNGMAIPVSDADIFNSTFLSLAKSYKDALEALERITKRKYRRIHIIGGGAKNEYLNCLTKKYTEKEVITYPIEGAAIGNIKIQMETKNDRRD